MIVVQLDFCFAAKNVAGGSAIQCWEVSTGLKLVAPVAWEAPLDWHSLCKR